MTHHGPVHLHRQIWTDLDRSDLAGYFDMHAHAEGVLAWLGSLKCMHAAGDAGLRGHAFHRKRRFLTSEEVLTL